MPEPEEKEPAAGQAEEGSSSKPAQGGTPAVGDVHPKSGGRRRFIRAILAVGAIAAVGGFFLSRYFPTQGTVPFAYPRQMIRVDDLPRFGNAAGMPVKVSDLTTFPANSNWVITYPSTGDLQAD